MRNAPKLSSLLTVLIILSEQNFASALITCIPDDQELGDSHCVEKYREGSYCTGVGVCSNPFRTGCLRNVLPNDFTKLRACNSYDDADAVERGECAVSPFDYEEVRILNQNWEGAMFSSWVMQIVLSEMLGVPTTIETGKPNTEDSMDFYDPDLRFAYHETTYDWDALYTASEHPDCESFQADQKKNGKEYRSCAHVMPEAWNGQKGNVDDAISNGIIEPTTGTGDVVKLSWFVPTFTAKRNTRLLSYFGMTENADDRENRRLMARTFLRPKIWKYFCENVSPNNCTTPYYDDEGLLIAARPPSDENEEAMFFLAGSYHGHFAATEENDCDANPLNCTGHISYGPCGWSSFAVPQAHHLGIHVKGNGPDSAGGYSYGQMLGIYKAANYTKSNVLFVWYTPDPTVQEYLGTDAEMQRILLPSPTEECMEARTTPDERCSQNPIIRFGDEGGSCDAESHVADKVIVSSLNKRALDLDETYRSPAYNTIENIKITDLQLEYMFRSWYLRNIDRWNYDPREAVCMWAAENIDTLLRFIPESHPRSFREGEQNRPSIIGAIATATISVVLVVAVSISTFLYRKKKVITYAQPNFLYMLLFGLLFLGVGAILYPLSPSQATCIAKDWFVLLGYSLHLVPLLVKVAAINKIFKNATKFRKVNIDVKKLYMNVGFVFVGTATFLLIWTLIDPQHRQIRRKLTDNLNEDGGQIVKIEYLCESDSSAWMLSSYAYQFVLLIAATVLAFQNRKVKQGLNDSSSLALIIYTHSILLLLRFLLLYYGSALPAYIVNTVISFLLSADIIMTIAIYFVPKLYAARKPSSSNGNTASRSIITSVGEIDDSKMSSVEKIRMSALKKSSQSDLNISKVSNCPNCGHGLTKPEGSDNDDDDHEANRKGVASTMI